MTALRGEFVQMGGAVVLLLAVALGVYGTVWLVNPPATVPATLGLAITLPPAVMSMAAVIVVCRRWVEAGPVVILSATFLRMGTAIVLVALLQNFAIGLGTTPTAIAEWTTWFYLITLAGEVLLLWWMLEKSPPKGVSNVHSDAGRG